MNLGEPKAGNTIEEAAQVLATIRQCKPFKYSGKWFVAVMPNGQGVAYRDVRDLKTRAIREGMQTVQIGTIG